jgi:hypothetical protein
MTWVIFISISSTQLGVLEQHMTLDQVIDNHAARARILETHHRLFLTWRRALTFTATPVVTRFFLARELLGAHGVELFLRAVAVIGLTRVQQLPDDLPITLHPGGLVKGSFVVLKTEPGHAFENRVDRFGGGSRQIRVLDAQDKAAAVLASIKPTKQRGAGSAYVQVAGRTGCKTGADGHR